MKYINDLGNIDSKYSEDVNVSTKVQAGIMIDKVLWLTNIMHTSKMYQDKGVKLFHRTINGWLILNLMLMRLIPIIQSQFKNLFSVIIILV